jgi:hypothetical protein
MPLAEKKNLLGWLSRLTEKELQQIAWAADCSRREVPWLEHGRAIKALFEAGRLFSADYANTARKLQGLPCAPLVEPPD